MKSWVGLILTLNLRQQHFLYVMQNTRRKLCNKKTPQLILHKFFYCLNFSCPLSHIKSLHARNKLSTLFFTVFRVFKHQSNMNAEFLLLQKTFLFPCSLFNFPFENWKYCIETSLVTESNMGPHSKRISQGHLLTPNNQQVCCLSLDIWVLTWRTAILALVQYRQVHRQ